jgi:inhibitor of KinA sporulation pathway (predicted exonuclease)
MTTRKQHYSTAQPPRVETEGRFDYTLKRQGGGLGQYARVIGHLEPCDEPLLFENRVDELLVLTQSKQDGEGGMINLDQYDYYLVLDLEGTCCDQETIKRRETEIIEIGAVMVDAHSLMTVDEFQTFVKPIRHPVLTEFCQSLTSITQSQVDQAPGYVEAATQLKNWLSNYTNAVFGSWGDYDRNQFKQDSKFHQVPFPIAFPHVNLKKRFTKVQGLPKRFGMAEALQLAGIELAGVHHRGIDDARNIAKLLPYILGKKQLPLAQP